MDDALAAAMSGDLDRAERAASVAELHGAIAWSRMLRGQVAHYRGAENEALVHLKAAVSLDPTSMTAKAMLASACVWAGDGSLFERTVEQMNQAPPVTAEDYLFRGLAEIHYDLGRAMESLEEATRLRPRSGIVRTARAEALIHHAWATFDLADAQDALEVCRTAKEMLPGNPAAIVVSGFSHMLAARISIANGEDAKLFLDGARADAKALEEFPECLVGYACRGWYYETAGEEDLSMEMWHQAVQRGAGGWIAVTYAAEMFHRNRSAEALKFLNQLRHPGDDSLDVARAYLMTDVPTQRPQALETCHTLMASGLGVNSSISPLTIMLLLGKKEEAQQLSLDLLEPLRTSVMRERSLAIEVVSRRRTSDAVLAELEASKRDQAVTRYVIAVDLLSQGRREEARSQFQRAATVAGGITNGAYWSRAFYERLSADPAWPPWIPFRADSDTIGATAPENKQTADPND